ncbi:MAG: TolC family protein [Gemmatimonadota bacterium]|nr:TolC family protein [Gemmatimonadota bacterium]
MPLKNKIVPFAAIVASAVVLGCATAIPSVNGVAGAPPTPSSTWTPPTRGVVREPASNPTSLPPDILARARSLTLGDVVDLALRNNPATRVSWSQARAAAAVYGSVQGALFPSVVGSATVSRTQSVPVNGGSSVQRTQVNPSLSLSYLLLDFGGRSGTIDAARQTLFAADFTHNATIQATVLQVEAAYFSYMANTALLGAERAAIAEAQANLAAAQQRDSVGLATIADVLQARTALSQEQLNLESIQGNLQAARGNLAAAMGIPANISYELGPLSGAVPVRAVNVTVDSLIADAVARRPDLAAARAAAAASADQIRVAQSAALPALTLGTTAGRTYSDPTVYAGGSYGLTLGVSVPIFSGFSRQYDIAAARARASAASAQADLLREVVTAQVFTSYYALQTAGQRVTTADDLLASALQSEQVAAGRYREGVGSIIDLLTAQSALANARAQQVQSRWQWYTALAQLAHDSGVLGTRGETAFPFVPASGTPSPSQPNLQP